MINQMKIYIRNIMKINKIIFLIINIILAQNIADNNVEYKKNSLDEIQTEINTLEEKLEKQIETQKGADEKLEEIKNKINNEKKELFKKQDQETYQAQLLSNINNIIDSLKINASDAQKERKKIQDLINEIEINYELTTQKIVTLNEGLMNTKNRMDSTLNKLDLIKINIKNIVQETVFLTPPSDLEFIIESNTWDQYILNTIVYDMIIDDKKEVLKELIEKKEKMNSQYSQNLNLQNTMIGNKKKLNKELKEYQKLEKKLNDDLIIIEKIIQEKELLHSKIIQEYNMIVENLNITEGNINLLKKEKKEMQEIQKKADNEKQRIEYTLILKKESRDKVKKEIENLLLKNSEYKGSNIAKLKNKLPWPLNGDIITKFGINISPSGTKFDYTSIEMAGDKILYLVNEINPKNPNKELVKKFQKITMGLKSGDTGYGVFGPQTTKKWKEYNEIKLTKNPKKPILAIHEGKIETIKFIDPITGVLIIIRHNDNSFTTYSGHIDLIVAENDIVSSGQKIGLIKQENILAFTLLVNGKIVNPSNWLVKK